jgi:hypothetical protein
MKKFECEVVITSKYIIEIDDEKLGQEFLDHYKKYFADINDWEEHAQNIAEQKAKNSDLEVFIEGYGVPLINGKDPRWHKGNGDLEKSINVNIIFENEVDVDCVEKEV